jgi:tetratricopeptide (TPR) repeat protein
VKNITPIILSSFFLLPAISIVPAATGERDRSTTHIAQNSDPELQQLEEAQKQTTARVNQTAKNITVRITSANNSGSGVLIAKKGTTYLILTNAHVTRRSSQFEIQAPDGQKYRARTIDGGFDRNYDLALLEFTSSKPYQLANLSNPGVLKPNDRNIYSVGFPFDSKDIRISAGEITQLSDIPFNNGTQIGYEIAKGEKGVRQGMSGGPIFDASGVFLGINTIGAAPILPNYTYNDGSKPLAKLAAKYRQANWGVPVYNFLIQVKPDILYGYKFNGLAVGKIQRQASLTGYMAKLNDTARQQTVRIENSGGNGSGVIVAREGNSYYVLTAKHVVENQKTQKLTTNNQIITYDQDRHQTTSTVVAEGLDLAVVKFTSQSNYPIAQLSRSNPNSRDLVLAGGFPGRDKINSPLWQWQLNPGYIFDPESGKFAVQDKQSFTNGYDLIYTSISYGGMSGGPVFDTAGRVLGIHGQAETTERAEILLGRSQGISIKTFIGIAERLKVKPQLLRITSNPPAELNAANRQTIITAMDNITPPQPGDDGERWLAYGNQLYRTRLFDKSVAAFDTAIAKGKELTGNYGRALSLTGSRKYDLAAIAIARAIALVPASQRANYYYFWKYQSIIFQFSSKYNDALKATNVAIDLEPNDPILRNDKAWVLSKLKKYPEAIAIYTELIRNKPEAYIYYNRGNAKSDQGDKQGAISDYDKAIAINPQDAEAYNNRGNIKSNLGKKQEAIGDYDKAIAINPKSAVTYYNRGIAKSDLGKKQEAISDFDKAISINPQYTNAYSNRGVAKSELGNKQGAISDFDKAIAINPKLAEAYYNRGLAKSTLGNNQGEISDYDKAIAINPKLAEAYYNRGLAKSSLGDKQGAISDFDKAISINPQDAKAYNNRGIAKFALDRKQGAISDYDKAISLDSKLAEAYVNRGIAKSDQGDKQGAISDYDKAIAINPQYAEAYFNRGIAKSNLGNKQGATSDYDKAISLDPKLAEAYVNRGIAKFSLGNKQGAISDFDKAISINPQYAEAYFNRGIAKSSLGNKQGAISDFDKAISINPQLAIAYYNRGNAKSDLGKKQEAIGDYDKAIALNRQYAKAYFYRGNAKYKLGNKQEAISDYDKAISINPQYAEAYFNRGIAKSSLGNKQGAISDYDKAISINPQYAEAYFNRGIAKSSLDNKQGAIADMNKAAELVRQQGRMKEYQEVMKEIAKLNKS